jgi:hypothetical protein
MREEPTAGVAFEKRPGDSTIEPLGAPPDPGFSKAGYDAWGS